MELGMVGLGRMGAGMARRLSEGGHRVVGWTPSGRTVEGIEAAGSVEDLVGRLAAPRVVWVMVPAGDPTEQVIRRLLGLLSPGDVLVDGGNSNYRDSIRRAEACAARGVEFCDAGTSGGIWGPKIGYCLMVGGSEEAFRRIEPLLRTLAPEDGYLRTGPVGSGHYVKMVHNGIEYGLLQAYGEGFEILGAAPFALDLAAVAELWLHGSVVRSWLLELARDALRRDPGLERVRGYVEDSGEGRWTVLEAIDRDVPAPVIALSLLARFRSRQDDSFSAKLIAALRHGFGGHAVKPE
jgi:6-phosphogluconate dehydrogenase